MLRKLAQTARWLDEHGLYAEADIVTDVMRKYASDSLFEEDDEEDVPDVDPYAASWGHGLPEVDLDNPEHFEIIRGLDENLANEYRNTKFPNRPSPTPYVYYGDRKVKVRPGSKKFVEGNIDRFFMTPEQLENNSSAYNDRFNKVTRGGDRRATFDLDYVSTSSPSRKRTYIYDPYLNGYLEQSSDPRHRTAPGNHNMFDRNMLRAVLDPTYQNDEFTEEELEKIEKARAAADDASKLGWIRKQVVPGRVLGVGRHKAEADPETGEKRRNWYHRRKTL